MQIEMMSKSWPQAPTISVTPVNGSIVKIPLIGSIFGWDRLKLITGKTCNSFGHLRLNYEDVSSRPLEQILPVPITASEQELTKRFSRSSRGDVNSKTSERSCPVGSARCRSLPLPSDLLRARVWIQAASLPPLLLTRLEVQSRGRKTTVTLL